MTALEALRADLAYVEDCLRSIHENAVEDGEARSLNADEQSAWDEGVAFVEATRSKIEKEEQREAVMATLSERRTESSTFTVPNVNRQSTDPFDLSGLPAYGEARSREIRGRAADAIERSDRFISDDHKERATEVLQRVGHADFAAEFILLGASETYADGFLRSLTAATAGAAADLSPEERGALRQRRELARAMGLSDVTGVLVPDHLDPTLILSNDGRTNPFRQVCRVETGVTNVYQSLTSAGVTHDWTAENAEVGDNAPSFSNPTATAFKGTAFVPISFEAYEDARGRESDIMMAIADAIDDAEATVFATGNGTTRPRGLVTALDANTNVEVNNTTSNVFGLEDVYALYEALPPRWRNERTAWFANLAIINDIRQFGTDSYNTQTVQLGARNVHAVLGHPILEASTMDGSITAGGQEEILIVGDPRQYLIYDRLGTSVEFVPNLFGTTNGRPTGQRGWLAHHRTGGNTVIDTAFRMLLAVTN